MALKSLDRLSRSKQSPEPAQEWTGTITRKLPSAEQMRVNALASGAWMSARQLIELDIQKEEALKLWMEHPLNVAASADYEIDPKSKVLKIYRRFGGRAWALGWNPLMETMDRKPGVYAEHSVSQDRNKGKLKRVVTKPSTFRDRQRSAFEMWYELDGTYAEFNLAMTNGLHGCTCTLDFDIRDQELVEQVHALADEVLGKSEFVRVNTWPKRQIIFHMSPEDLKATSTMSFELFDADGKLDQVEEIRDGKARMVPRNAVEFLSYGHNWTAYGRGKRGNAISWALGTKHPAIAGPEETPLIDPKKLKVFFERLYELRRFKQSGSSSSSPFGAPVNEVTSFERADDQRVWQPKVSTGIWTVDENGIVTDGREPFAAHMAWSFCAANAHLLMNDQDAAAVRDTYIAYVTNKCFEGQVKNRPAVYECKPKFSAARSKWVASMNCHAATGKYHDGMVPYRVLDNGSRPCAQHIPAVARPADGSLDWLPESGGIVPELGGRSKIANIIVREKSKEDIALDKQCRALVESVADREAIHARVAVQIEVALDTMLAEVLERENTGDKVVVEAGASGLEIGLVQLLPLHILGAPTGAGKTTTAIRKIGAWCKLNPRRVGSVDLGPVILAAPTGENIEEAKRTAERSGMTVPNPELSIDEIEAKLKANGVKVVVIRGKGYNKCQRIGEVQALNSRGMSSARLCEARVPKDIKEALYGQNIEDADDAREIDTDDDEKFETVLCPFKADNTCEYWKQMKEAETADIILIPHAYLTTQGVPKVIKNVRAVFIDESITYRVLHQLRMPMSGLDVPRNPPWLTKAEKIAEVKAEEVHHGFEMARKVAVAAMKSGRCPAADLAADKHGSDYLDAAIKTCDRNHRDEKSVRPDLTADEITQLTARETGTNLAEETLFWRTVKERVVALVMDKHEPLPTKRARGDREMRLQIVHLTIDGVNVPFVRVSWRSEPNWAAAPMMLLDASASPKIMAKVFSREIVRHDVEAPLHVRTVAMVDSAFSNSSFIPREGASADQIAICKHNVIRARALINKVAVSYSFGMVLVGMAMAVRQVIFAADWTAPQNVEVVHFGALRGLDFAKDYVAALSIGRSEQPVHIIDGYAAALAYDDETPEWPHDKLGTGFTVDKQPVFRVKKERLLQMRTGEDYGVEVPEMPSAWGKELEEQWREEEQRQFVGRLRPVYRLGDAPTWICMTKCMPTGFIVDDVVALNDTLQDAAVWSMLKRCNGALLPGLTDQLPWTQKLLGGKDLIGWFKDILPTDKAFQSRMMQTLYEVRYAMPDGSRKTGRVAGWHTDPASVVQSLADLVGVAIHTIKVKPLVRERVIGARRKPDRIATELVAAKEARQQAKADAAVRTYVADIHSFLPDEENITVEELYAGHLAGEDIEGRLIVWLHSWHPDRDIIGVDEVKKEWEAAKAVQTIDELKITFGIGRCIAAE
ncbi:hypothetical protein [Devosia sp. A449]